MGPLLFLIYINDLPDYVSSCCSLFADDCLIYRQINDKFDQDMLQQDLQNLQLWASKWLMTFNLNKCAVLQISLRNMVDHSYILYDHPLQNVNKAKYIGIIIRGEARLSVMPGQAYLSIVTKYNLWEGHTCILLKK